MTAILLLSISADIDTFVTHETPFETFVGVLAPCSAAAFDPREFHTYRIAPVSHCTRDGSDINTNKNCFHVAFRRV